MTTHRLALIGAGAMGTNHARVIADSPRAVLEVVVDADKERARLLTDQFGGTVADLDAVLDCDAVIVAASTQSHTAIALPLIDQGVPILVEKPLALTLAEAQALCRAATDRGSVLACGFVERFGAVVNQGMKLLDETPIHIVTMRHSPVAERIAGSVVYDLLIHDIDLALLFMGDNRVTGVSGTSWRPDGGAWAEIADCGLQFAHGGLATMSASRAGQRKLRSVQVFTRSMMLELDLLRADLTVYRNVRLEQSDVAHSLTYRAETIVDIPFVRHIAEPLALQLDHFLNLVEGKADRTAEIVGVLPPHIVAEQVEQECERHRASVTSSGEGGA
jgi:predicted dehydrogenase